MFRGEFGFFSTARTPAADPSYFALKTIKPRPRFRPPAPMAHGHTTAVVAASGTVERRKQTLFRALLRQCREVGDLHEALARRARIELNYRHDLEYKEPSEQRDKIAPAFCSFLLSFSHFSALG